MEKRKYVKPTLSGEEFVPQVYCKNCSADDNKKWVYDEETLEWREHDTGIQMSLYDMNKQLIA